MTAPEKVTGVELTEAAQQKASALLAQEGRDDLSLRIAVQPGSVCVHPRHDDSPPAHPCPAEADRRQRLKADNV